MITALYASLLGILFFYLSIETILARRKNKISLGFGENNEIAAIVSAHNNFSSYIPMLLFLLYFLEKTQAMTPWVLHLFGATILLGRLLHFLAFRAKKMNFKWRRLGMHLTLWTLLVLSLLNLGVFVWQSSELF